MYTSVFDIPVKDKDGTPNMLDQYRGKALMFVNTTGHCGNASQWPILNSIMDEYREKNFQIIYVPTNDYCGSVTVAPYKDGIKDANESFDFANKTYGIEDPFTELLSSRDTPWTFKVDTYLLSGNWERNTDLHETIQQPPKSELYRFLIDGDGVGGNFHKIITNTKGVPVAWIENPFLNNGPRFYNSIEIIEDTILLNNYDITSFVIQYIDMVTLKNNDRPHDKVRTLLFELGQEKIHSWDANILYRPERELIEWTSLKHLYPTLHDFRMFRSQRDIVEFKTIINEVLETDKCTHELYCV